MGGRFFPAPHRLEPTALVAPILARHPTFFLEAIPRFQDFFQQMDLQRMIQFRSSALKNCRPVLAALCVSTAVVILGCGGDNSGLARRYKVTGKVTYKGAPVSQGSITFEPTKPPIPEGHFASGTIKDGFYTLSTSGDDDGALPGDYKVIILATDLDMTDLAKKSGGMIHQGDKDYQKAVQGAKSLIPAKYNKGETSGLTATVETSSKEINFELKDE